MHGLSNKLLILDLDETLIHATETRLAVREDFVFDKYFVHKRPHLNRFLADIAQHFTIGIWSSADDNYVLEIVNRIMPAGVTPAIVWGRSKCTLKKDYIFDNYYFEKKLDKLKKQGFALHQVLIVDDSPEKSKSNYGNAVYIKGFTGSLDDQELPHLHDYLLTLKDVENVRTIEKRGWRKGPPGAP